MPPKYICTHMYTHMCMHVSIYTCFKYYQYLFHFKIQDKK